jgi:hypothetical protein
MTRRKFLIDFDHARKPSDQLLGEAKRINSGVFAIGQTAQQVFKPILKIIVRLIRIEHFVEDPRYLDWIDI